MLNLDKKLQSSKLNETGCNILMLSTVSVLRNKNLILFTAPSGEFQCNVCVGNIRPMGYDPSCFDPFYNADDGEYIWNFCYKKNLFRKKMMIYEENNTLCSMMFVLKFTYKELQIFIKFLLIGNMKIMIGFYNKVISLFGKNEHVLPDMFSCEESLVSGNRERIV